MLFAMGEPVKGGPPADSSWELLNADMDNLLPNAGALRDAELFAAEILGEETPAPAQGKQQRATEPPAPPRETPKPTQAQKPMTTQAPKPVPTQPPKPVTTQPPKPVTTQAPKPVTTQAPKPVTTQAQKPVTTQTQTQGTPAPRAAVTPRPAVRTLPAAVAPAPTTKTTFDAAMPTPPRRKRPGANRHTPAIVFGVGASVAAGLELIQHNHVLAAIVGCATLVGVLFAWLWNRW
jgi:outer membrane biosynthesis protein TonB